jgi:hypothetical protein
MRPDDRLRTSSVLLAAALAALPVACGKGKGPEGSAPAASGSASAGAPVGSAAAAPAPAEAEAPKPAAQGRGIQVSIKDLQLFSPYSSERAMPSVRDNGSYSTRDSTPYYGLGIIVEATNETGEVLNGAWFEGTLRFVNGDHEVECRFTPDSIGDVFNPTLTLHYNNVPADAKADPFTGEKPTAWRNESSSTNEGVWRPGERIRLASRRNECDSVVLADMPPTQIRGSLVVKSDKRFVDTVASEFQADRFNLSLVGDAVRIIDKASSNTVVVPLKDNVVEMRAAVNNAQDMHVVPLSYVRLRNMVRYSRADVVESAPVTFELPPQALTLQMVKLPSGDMVHASANVLVFPKDGKVVYQDMARQKLSLLDVGHEEVPAATPEVSFTKDELSGKVKGVSLTHFADDESLSKGQRKLSVTWNLHLQGDGIDQRLRAPFDVATSELEQATAELDKVSGGEAAAIAAAKAAEAKARAAKSAAETKYKTGLKTEREKLAKAFPCADVKIATNRGTKGPSNSKAAGESCKVLIQNDDAEVTITYTLDRYEIPVALVYSVGGAFTWSPIASAPLLKLDAR